MNLLAKLRSLVPKETSPTAKLIRTLEGVLLLLFNAAMLIVPIVTSALPPIQAAKWAAVTNMVAFVSRQGTKAVAIFAQKTGLKPTDLLPGQTPADAAKLVQALITQARSGVTPANVVSDVETDAPIVENLVKDAEEFHASPGEEIDPPQPKTFRNDPHTVADSQEGQS